MGWFSLQSKIKKSISAVYSDNCAKFTDNRVNSVWTGFGGGFAKVFLIGRSMQRFNQSNCPKAQ
jgi:hypothetical protein